MENIGQRCGAFVIAIALALSAGLAAGEGVEDSATKPADAGKALSPKELFAKVSPAVVKIHTYNRYSRLLGQGSGFFVSADGMLVTNYHVMEKAASAKVLLPGGKELGVSGMLASMPNADLALLKVQAKGLAFLRLAKNQPDVGTKVWAIGSPKGLDNTLSEGLVSGYRDIKGKPTLLQTTAPISPGSSGGPLVIDTGQVVGVTTLTRIGGQNLNFAVPCKYIQAILLIAGKPRPLSKAGLSSARAANPSKGKVPPAPEGKRKTYTSIRAIMKDIPRELRSGATVSLGTTIKARRRSADRLQHWLHNNIVGHRLNLQRTMWNGVEREYAVFSHTRFLRITLCYREAGVAGTYYARIYCQLYNYERDKHLVEVKKIDARRHGERIGIEGIVQDISFEDGSRSLHLAGDFGVTSTSSNIKFDSFRGEKRFTDKTGVGVHIHLADWVAPAPPPKRQPRSRPSRSVKELTPEEKAARQLRTAKMYLGIGKKGRAIGILKSILADYPDTEAAKVARQELCRLTPEGE